ncbi:MULTISPECIES: stage VI sporulation protein F [Paenibacillus]|uniref:Serine/threonine protein kinase n=1 Tax=Paenibacillus phytohabitans TaxID=2654978 RepID=A0ABX1YDN7_9BACL|nr:MULTISPECIES: stage VI sporulation protein F [Paenibacillus]AIQ29484.1 serine/threonine protein kinase [Paenibacillus sp. FSL P4-0081]AIQ41175.1 serine/threonine protein kinase [Paenibacillus sp. FSL R5-0912]KHL95503.1 serine/threonine protein kinase [Paenibacillus sp. IHB B 3415]NOU78306.1 serine/threonine protein kinase [Paenibacillus phytohabitans]OMF26000.1 serine/threonine protein kinase [Paenibacillus sp. FSL H8-0259]
MGYQQFGISPALVDRIKLKMKNPAVKERIKNMINGISKQELQDTAVVRRLVRNASAVMNEKLTSSQEEQIVKFVIAQKIDPGNTFHLIRLWGMFR